MTQTPPQRTMLAVWLLLLALLLFDGMGLLIKHLSARYGAAELSAYRNVIGLIPAAVALWWADGWHRSGRRLRIRQWRLALARGGMVILAQYLFYLALAKLAFATATTISYSNALFMVALAVPILGERVGWVRWSAVLVGGAGVLMVTGLGTDAFSWEALLPVGAGALYALSGLTARLVDDEVPTPLLNLYSSGTAAVGAFGLAVLLGGFSPVAGVQDAGMILAMGCLGGAAVLTMIVAFRMAEQSDLAPFNYFGIPLAFLLGWLVYGEAPWGDLFPGALLIAAGGLLIVWRERQKRQSAQR